MRRSLPALSFHFGIKGSDLDEMPYGEIEAYLDALDEMLRAQRRAQRKR